MTTYTSPTKRKEWLVSATDGGHCAALDKLCGVYFSEDTEKLKHLYDGPIVP